MAKNVAVTIKVPKWVLAAIMVDMTVLATTWQEHRGTLLFKFNETQIRKVKRIAHKLAKMNDKVELTGAETPLLIMMISQHLRRGRPPSYIH